MTKPLTQEALAAMAMGVDLTSEEGQQALAAAQALVAAAANKPGAAPAVATVPATEAKPAATAPAVATGDVTGFAVVSGLLAEAQGKNGVLTAQVSDLTARVAASGETLKPFLAIARSAVKNMSVALKTGATAESIDGLSVEALGTEYTRLSTLFASTFKAGGVSGAPTEVDKAGTETKAESEIPLAFALAAPVKAK